MRITAQARQQYPGNKALQRRWLRAKLLLIKSGKQPYPHMPRAARLGTVRIVKVEHQQ